jgi:ribosomal protein S6
VLIDFELEPHNIANLENSIKFEEKIIRYLLVLGSKKILKPQPEQPQEEK